MHVHMCVRVSVYNNYTLSLHVRSIERLKKENSGFKRDARDWEMEAKKLRKQNESLEFKVECLEASCELIIFTHTNTYMMWLCRQE